MKLKLLKNVLVDHNTDPRKAGSIVDIPEDRARFYIQNGMAEEHKGSEKAEVTVDPDPVLSTGKSREVAPAGTPTKAADDDRAAVAGTAGSTGTTGAGAGVTTLNTAGAAGTNEGQRMVGTSQNMAGNATTAPAKTAGGAKQAPASGNKDKGGATQNKAKR